MWVTVKTGGVRLSDNILDQYETFKYTTNYLKQARENNWKLHKMPKKIDCCFFSPNLVWCPCQVCFLNCSSGSRNTVKNLMNYVFYFSSTANTCGVFIFYFLKFEGTCTCISLCFSDFIFFVPKLKLCNFIYSISLYILCKPV